MITSILPTDECNLSCTYCNARKGHNRMNRTTLYNTIDFCAKAHELNCENGHIEWHAAEPMMMPLEFYEDAERRFTEIGCNIDRVICSNMTLATPEWYDFIQKYDYGVSTSLDGDIFINDKNMGSGAFDTIIKSMIEMNRRKIPFGCIAVLSEYACDHIDEFYPFFHHMNQGIKLNFQTPNNFQEKSAIAAIKLFDEWYDNKSYIRIDPFNIMIQFILLGKTHLKCYPTCNEHVVCIDTFGDVYPCECFVLNNANDDYVLGNVNKNTFDEIWYGDARAKFLSFVYNLDDECQECDYVDFCAGGCAADSIAIGNTEIKKASSCGITKPLMDHINAKIGWLKDL